MDQKDLHPIVNEGALDTLAWQLAKAHGYKDGQNAILFYADNEAHLITAHITQKNLHLETLFDWQEEQSVSCVTQLPGYPFDLAIGMPPYHTYFHPDYPHSAKLPVEVTFIYHALQLLAVDGLLIILASLDQKNWPVVELDKIVQKIDEYVLSSAYGSSVEHALMVFRRKATDAVRYE